VLVIEHIYKKNVIYQFDASTPSPLVFLRLENFDIIVAND